MAALFPLNRERTERKTHRRHLARLLLNLELMKAGLLPVNVKYADRRRYYDCFDDYHAGSGTAEKLAALVAEYEVEELGRYIAAVKAAGENVSE